MQSFRASALCGAAVAAVALAWSNPGHAYEPGDFGQYLSGNNIGAMIAAPPPPGLYGVLDTFVAPRGTGTGQNLGNSTTSFLFAPTLFWSTGYKFLGANVSMAVVQPFLETAVYPTNGASLGGNNSGPPFGGTVWFDNIENTQLTPLFLQWTLGQGWFAGTAMTFIIPDGSRYNGTLNSDYFSYQPRAFLAYANKDWHISANFRYDINTSSAGHTGAYQIAANLPFPLGFGGTPLSATVAGIGNGYRSGDVAFLDAAALYQYKRWELGPVASFKYQTTDDRPGGGFTCASLRASLPTSLQCGKSENVAIGGLVGLDLGVVHMQAWLTDTVHTKDDFGGLGVYSRLVFPLWAPDAPTRPLITK